MSDGDTVYPYASEIEIEDALGVNAKDVSVKIEPVQDLHGYDKPWAGGAGKNKLPMTVAGIKSANTSGTWSGNAYTINGVTFTILTDSDGNVTGIKVNGTASADSIFKLAIMPIKADTSYVMNGCPQTGSQSTYVLYVDGKPTSYFDYGNGVTWSSVGSDTSYDIRIFVANGYNSNNLTFLPMIRLSTVSDATFEPYENICPISGFTETGVVVEGKNLYNPTTLVSGYYIDKNFAISIS